MGLLYGENCMILTSTVFEWSARVTDGQRDRRTDGIAIAYARLQHSCRAQKCSTLTSWHTSELDSAHINWQETTKNIIYVEKQGSVVCSPDYYEIPVMKLRCDVTENTFSFLYITVHIFVNLIMMQWASYTIITRYLIRGRQRDPVVPLAFTALKELRRQLYVTLPPRCKNLWKIDERSPVSEWHHLKA